jgi:acid phosphatase
VFGQLLATRHTAKTYAEAMRAPCELHSDGRYAVKHNPWAYFSTTTERSACRRYDVAAGTVSAGALHDDVARGALPTLGFVVPDLCHDGHNCSTATADAWLKGWVPVLMRGSDYRAGRLVIVITFDEDDHTASNRVLTAVIHPSLTHKVVSLARNHYSLSASISGLAGRTPLQHAARAANLLGAFNL